MIYEKDFQRYADMSREYASGPYDVCESSTHLFFSYGAPFTDQPFYTCFNKRNNTVFTFQVKDFMSEWFLNTLTVTDDDRFISYIEPGDLEYISDYHENKIKNYHTLMSIYKTLPDPELANPILVLYKFKSL